MSVGWAIVLSACILALVILYGITKDRWRWRRAARGAMWVIVVLAGVGGSTAAGIYLWNLLPIRVSKQTEYAGLRIGMPPEEVKYIKGVPPTVFGEAATEGDMKGFQPIIETKNLEKGRDVEDYRDWSYDIPGARLDVEFDAAKKAVIVIRCYSADHLKRCPSIAGIVDGDSEQDVIRKLGQPDRAPS